MITMLICLFLILVCQYFFNKTGDDRIMGITIFFGTIFSILFFITFLKIVVSGMV
jgi:hypothetical protein